MVNPTDELRAKLDELGIAWFAIAESATEYTKEGVVYRAYEFCGGMQVAIVTPVTPEQAVAATVGEEHEMHICKRCGVAYELNIIDKGFGKPRFCPNCGHKELYQ